MKSHENEAALAEAERRVREAVLAGGFAAESVSVDRGAGPAGTMRVRAAAAGAYPGTGVSVALVHAGLVYGPRAGLAELVRALSWIDAPPDAQVAAAVANDLLWDGLLALDNDEAPRLSTLATGGLRLELARRTFPSGARERLRIDIPKAGTEKVSTGSAEPESDGPIPIDRAAALLIALDAGVLSDTLAAVRAIDAPATPREFAALARAALSHNDALGADALMKLGPSDAAAEALRVALAAADPQRQANVRAMAAELWGPGFAGRLG